MKEYEPIDVKVIFFLEKDIITNSSNENADDFGDWNSDWF